ncbi:MAG: alpha/beta fold hydrolase [Pirellulales bacterium]|nr:alpha/beta fold hydrolase [Pirellulales bacterium]
MIATRALKVLAAGHMVLFSLVAVSGSARETNRPADSVQESLWNGYQRLDFRVDGRPCLLVLPKTAAPGNPWIWRTEFFGHEPQGDLGLLAHGFHVAYIDVQNMYGAPVAMSHMDAFHSHLTDIYGLSSRTVLEGFSRGGLFALNWAARHPDKVAAIYVDAPVCDFKSWPGGKGKSKGSPADWQRLLNVYGLSEQEAMEYNRNPVDNLQPLARAGLPILSVCGLVDQVVPFDENTGLLARRYKAMGGSITVLTKPFCDHHPHSLREPAPIVNFVLSRASGMAAPGPVLTPDTPHGYDYFVLRDGLANCRIKFERAKTGRVVFLGGSITNMKGWRDLVCQELQRRFPQTTFDFINAGIPSMGSTPGAFRFARDVLGSGAVDLLFEEAAVNDSTNGRTNVEQIRGMEGIVRQARLANPAVDIVLLYFVDPEKMAEVRHGKLPAVIANHEKVAAYYALPSINLAQEVTERIAAGEFTWEKDFRDLHPALFGQELYTRSIARLLNATWAAPLRADAKVQPYSLPAKPLDAKSYFHGQLLDVRRATVENGWKLDPDWRPADKAGTRAGFVNVPMLIAEEPVSTLKLKFTGTAVGIFVAAGPDAGIVEYRVDGGATNRRDLYTQWSGTLHLPWAQVLAADLTPGAHELELRVSPDANTRSKGHAVRIAHFLVN